MNNELNELKQMGIHVPAKRAKGTHKEADLHLKFCKWVKSAYPGLKFVRHEKEGKRGKFMQNASKVYNTDSGLPDFELLAGSGFYLEFKRRGEEWQSKGAIKAQYQHQYEMHLHLWSIGRCAYFCNDFEMAKELVGMYMEGEPYARQEYAVKTTTKDDFFSNQGIF
jgi:hypothetical protein